MSLLRVARILRRRPDPNDFQAQLFWLVKLTYACKSSGHNALVAEAQVIEDALGHLGRFVEDGDSEALQRARTHIDQFAELVEEALAAEQTQED